MSDRPAEAGIYGLMAEFAGPEQLVAAAHRVREAGYRKIDAFTPYPIEELSHALGHPRSKLPLITLLGGLLGGSGGYLLQAWSAVIKYPMNIGGRPYLSWPAFIVPTYECTILGACLAAVVGLVLINGLPRPYHPVFNVPRFALASSERYFLLVEAADPKFDRDATRSFLSELSPREVSDVEP